MLKNSLLVLNQNERGPELGNEIVYSQRRVQL